MKKLTVLIILYGLVLILPSKILAQNVSFSINPPLTEILIKPGKSITQTVKIVNSGTDGLVSINLVPFDESGLRMKEPEPLKWLEILNPEVTTNKALTIRKNEEISLVVKINPPGNTEEKDYYQALAVTSHPAPFEGLSQSAVSTTLASLFLISVSNNGLEKKAEVTDFKLPFIHESTSALPVNIRVKNTGLTFFRLNGKTKLEGFLGTAEFKIIPQALLINQERQITIEEQNSRIPGFYLGKYKLTYDFSLDEGSIRLKGEKIFYALPWKLALIVIGLGLLITAIKKLKNRLRPKNRIK